MKSWPTSNWPTLLANGAKLCSVITLLLQNGQIKRYTDNTNPITISGNTYTSNSGMERTAISLSTSLDTSNLDLQFFMNPAQSNTQISPAQPYVTSDFTLINVLAGVYRGAHFNLALIFPDHISDGVMPFLSGILGETKIGRNTVKNTLEGQTYPFDAEIPLITTPTCRNKFGDTKCQINAGSMAISTSIVSLTDNQNFIVGTVLNQPAIVAGYPNVSVLPNVFIFGSVTWTSGNNNGISVDITNVVLGSSTTAISLWLPPGFTVQVGDTVTLTPGCSKQRSNCVAYKNALNMNAEPDTPGATLMNSATTQVA